MARVPGHYRTASSRRAARPHAAREARDEALGVDGGEDGAEGRRELRERGEGQGHEVIFVTGRG